MVSVTIITWEASLDVLKVVCELCKKASFPPPSTEEKRCKKMMEERIQALFESLQKEENKHVREALGSMPYEEVRAKLKRAMYEEQIKLERTYGDVDSCIVARFNDKGELEPVGGPSKGELEPAGKPDKDAVAVAEVVQVDAHLSPEKRFFALQLAAKKKNEEKKKKSLVVDDKMRKLLSEFLEQHTDQRRNHVPLHSDMSYFLLRDTKRYVPGLETKTELVYTVDIVQVGVKRKYRRQGVFKDLLAHLQVEARRLGHWKAIYIEAILHDGLLKWLMTLPNAKQMAGNVNSVYLVL